MRCLVLCLSLAATLSWTQIAKGDIIFTTQSTATQVITSPLFGGSVSLTATGPQVFTLNPATGFADVTSDFKGSDLPDPLNPGGFLSYDLFNTTTMGTVVQNPSGSFDVSFEVLFELRVTSGPLAGLTFETQQFATFSAANVPAIPFPPGTAFSDPTPPDTLPIFVKFDPTGTFPPGALVGTSSNRVVTINSVVPEPPGAILLASAGLLGALWMRRRGPRGGTRAGSQAGFTLAKAPDSTLP